jgi:outer membrane protein, heavy metal efflux system
MILRLACALVALTVVSFAQIPLSLEDAIREAETKRPELRTAAQRIRAGDELRHQAALFPNPRLFLQSENIRSSNFDYSRDADTFAYLSQVFETSGRRKGRIEAAAADAQRRRLQSEQVRREIVFKVRLAYWNALAAHFTTELYRQSEEYFDQIVQYHEARLREGKLAEIDLLRIRLQAQQIRAGAAIARLRSERAQLNLAREMGRPEPGPWLLTEKFDEPESPRELPAETDVVNSRIEGRLAQQEVAAARAQLGLEKAKGRPDLDALFGYKRTAGLNTAIAGLQFNIPVFDRNQGATSAARSEVNAAESSVQAARIQFTLERSLARREYETRLEQVKSVFGPMRDRAVQIVDISRAAYKEGGLELLRLLDAERLRVDTQLVWIDALSEYHKSVVEVERAEGVEP